MQICSKCMDKGVYLVVADYFSRFVEVLKLTSTTSTAIVKCFKALFAVHGIPTVLMTDNGPQFDSIEMKLRVPIGQVVHVLMKGWLGQ